MPPHRTNAQKITKLLPTTNNGIIFYWTPSHIQIHSNDLADRAANQSYLSLPVANIPILLTDHKYHAKYLYYLEFENF